MNKIINNYIENGYHIERNLIKKEICNEIINELKEIKTDMKIPFTNVQFGYGNLIDHKISDYLKNNDFVKTFCNEFYKSEYKNYHLYIHNKAKWVGPDIEWHQEIFNINSFNPIDKELSDNEVINNYMQIYLPLQKQNLENGGLKIIPKSHKLGKLRSYDTLNTHFNHKRAILPEDLDMAYKKCGILNLELNAGDVLFFNHLIAHSSTSNNSPFDRKACVLLTYKINQNNINEEIKKKESEYRKNFAINSIKNILNKKLN